MPLPLPSLDQRRFDDLVDEALDLLPRAAPDWTEHNASDPGVTLIELLAYLAEQIHYKFDRVTPEQRRTWLRLIGQAPRPARPAQAVLALDNRIPGTVLRMRSGLQVTDGADAIFETQLPIDAFGARLSHLLTRSAGRDTVHAQSPAGDPVSPLLPLGPDPQPGDMFCLGFGQPLAGDDRLVRIGLVGADPAGDAATWRALVGELRASRRPGSARHQAGRPSRHYGVSLAWEYWDTTGHWRALSDVRDGTRALSLAGTLRFRGLGAGRHGQGAVAAFPDAYFIRALVVAGRYDEIPRLSGVALNAVPARHGAGAAESLGPSDGGAGQTHRMLAGRIAPGTARLTVTADGVSETWTEVSDWDASGPDDAHYSLDATAGELRFGDGRRGRVPPAGARIELRHAQAAARGDLAAGSLTVLRADGPNATIAGWPLLRTQLAVRQPFAALAAQDAESIDAAEARAATDLPMARCATTLDDFERLARSAPGLPVARAYAIAGFHPQLSGLPAEGCITVVVVPRGVEQRPDPSAALLDALAAYLHRRRPLATELQVCGPRWTKVAVHAQLHLEPGAPAAAVGIAARAAMRAFFHPLRGGPLGQGWPAGRDVHRSEVLGVLMGVSGVQYVSELELQQDDEPPTRCGRVVLCKDALVLDGEHRLELVGARTT